MAAPVFGASWQPLKNADGPRPDHPILSFILRIFRIESKQVNPVAFLDDLSENHNSIRNAVVVIGQTGLIPLVGTVVMAFSDG
jgi:hypothetical protein